MYKLPVIESINRRANLYFIKMVMLFLIMLFLYLENSSNAQSRIHYVNKNIFISGINIAWVNYAADLEPTPSDTAKFRQIFQTVHQEGGNVLRLWLHTNGTNSPEFNSSGFVTGLATVAIKNLRQILRIALQNNIGLILCL